MLSLDAVARVLAREERGQASLMMLAVVAAVLVGAVVLFGLGIALGAKGRYQRAADLAAISAAQVMRDLYPRLFEPPFLEPGVRNPRHLEDSEYRALAVTAAIRGGRKNGAAVRPEDVTFPESGFAPPLSRLLHADDDPADVLEAARLNVESCIDECRALGLTDHEIETPAHFAERSARSGADLSPARSCEALPCSGLS